MGGSGEKEDDSMIYWYGAVEEDLPRWYRLDESGNPVRCTSLDQIPHLLDYASRRVGIDVVDGVEISTVFLCMDHRIGEGPPLLYETMIFGGPLDQEQERYSTRAEAEAGHKRWVEAVRKGIR